MKKTTFLIACIILSLSVLSAQNIYRVSASAGNDSNDGTDWTNAFATLQAALDVAVSGDKIWVATGTYNPTKIAGDTPGTDPRDKTFVITNGVSVYGGFSGTESANYDLSLRDFETNETILSGDISADANDAYHVAVLIGKNGNVTLDGFTITGGNANAASGNVVMNGVDISKRQGGGVNVQTAGSEAKLVNNIISNNLSANWGGGVYVNSGATASGGLVYINKNKIINNSASSSIAGGIYAFVNNAAIHMTNNLFYGNTASSNNAGAAYINIQKTNNAYFINNTVSKNTSVTGALYCFTPGTGNVYITNSIIYGNTPNTIAGHSTNVGNIFVSYSIVGGGVVEATKITASNIINSDPLFVDATSNNFQLQTTSPAKNAGNTIAYDSGLYGDTDLNGDIRVAQTTIDLGAYEIQFTTAFNNNTAKTFQYNNLVEDLFRLEGLSGTEKISIFDVQGRQILTGKPSGSEFIVSTTSFASGIYLVRIQSDEVMKSFKILKK